MEISSVPHEIARNKYLLTFIDYFSNYAEVYPIPDQTAEVCARVCATKVVIRYGTVSTLITDQGRAFMSFLVRHGRY